MIGRKQFFFTLLLITPLFFLHSNAASAKTNLTCGGSGTYYFTVPQCKFNKQANTAYCDYTNVIAKSAVCEPYWSISSRSYVCKHENLSYVSYSCCIPGVSCPNFAANPAKTGITYKNKKTIIYRNAWGRVGEDSPSCITYQTINSNQNISLNIAGGETDGCFPTSTIKATPRGTLPTLRKSL